MLESKYSSTVKRALKLPKYANKESIFNFYGFYTLEQQHQFATLRIQYKKNTFPKPLEAYDTKLETRAKYEIE